MIYTHCAETRGPPGREQPRDLCSRYEHVVLLTEERGRIGLRILRNLDGYLILTKRAPSP